MKTIKSILVVATLICATAVSTLSAQQAEPKQHTWKVAVGDSVMIKPECQQYLTGEKPSTWVYDKVHTVRQLGTKRFPEGVLLMNIYSWICEECLVPVHPREAQPEQPAEETSVVEQKPVEETPVVEQKPAEETPVVEQKPAEETPVVEQKPAEETPTVEPKPAEEEIADESAVSGETAKGDSIKSKQKFGGKYDRFTIGLRGGASSLMHHADKGNWTCGGDVVLDLQYAHYWTKDGRPVDLGLIVGLGIGYMQSGLKVGNDSTFFTKSGVDYTVLASNIKETDHQLQLEVPLMFSLISEKGVFFNIGPKFMIPVYSPYKQTVDQNNTHITAYFPNEGITVTDETVTGKYTGQQPTTKNGIQFNVNVMLTAEIGYEWVLKSGNSFGLGAYANYSVFNTFKNTTSTEGLFDLTAPTETSAAILDVQSATKTYADKLGYFDAGLKLAYHFNFPKKRQNKDSQLFGKKVKKNDGAPQE
ncbi:MAG: hypothetical protein SPK97_01580 [Bacteroidales bacterium]|nr:hypothetical protein [Bacteroidales bacterium]